MRKTITAIIPAKNEQDNIARCIESVAWCDKVQVLWMGFDKTGEIAHGMNAEVIEMNKKEESDFIAVQKNVNWAIVHATTDWILRIDADEVVTNELRDEIIKILSLSPPSDFSSPTTYNLQPTTYVAYGVPRKQYFWNGFLTGGDWAYDRLVRLFRPQYAKYEPLVAVHEQFKIDGQIGTLNHYLLHYSHPSLKIALEKFDLYTTLEAMELKENALIAIGKLIFLPPYVFLRWMIWHKGYRDGIRGIVAGAFRAWYDLLLYWKYLMRIFTKK